MSAGVVLGYLKYVLGFDSVQFRKGMSEAERELAVRQKSFIKQGEKLQRLGKGMAAFITLPLAGLAAKGIKEAQDTAAAMGQVNAALASMGPVAGRSAEQLKKAANAFEKSSLYEADQVLRDVTANMLTFGNVAGTNFDRAQQAAIDLATRMKIDLKSATILVGKALNDPIKGMAALSRAGIQFTDQQKEQIKTMAEAGDAAGAQAVMLAELERQFRGSAQAAQDADPWNRLKDAFNELAEVVGERLLPLIVPLIERVSRMVESFAALPTPVQGTIVAFGAAAAAAGPLLIAIGALTKGFAALVPLMGASTVAAAGATAASAVALGPILGVLAAAVIAVYAAYQHWDKVKPYVDRLVVQMDAIRGKFAELDRDLATFSGWVDRTDANIAEFARNAWTNFETLWNRATVAFRGIATAAQTWLGNRLNAIWDGMKAKLQEVGDKAKWLWDVTVGHSYFPDMVERIGRSIAELQKLMVDPALSAAQKVEGAFQHMAGIISDLFGHKAGSLLASVGQLFTALAPVLGIKVPGAIGEGGATPRAQGGPVVPGRTYLVGERGPEYVRFGSRGYVTPPRDGGGAARVTVVPSPYFEVVVDGRAAAVAVPLAGQAAVSGAAGAQMHSANAMRRRIP